MADRPIIFSAPMVQALLAGRCNIDKMERGNGNQCHKWSSKRS